MNASDQNSDKANMRGEYNFDELEIKKLGAGWSKYAETTWAVCVNRENRQFVPLKIYKIEIYPNLGKVKATAENGEEIFCPPDWFMPLKFDKTAASIFERVAV